MKKLLALVLSVAICVAPFAGAFAMTATAETIDEKTIAYLPLDDRPVNVERVIYQARSAGYKLLMPDRDIYATHLDNQPTNSNGTQYGDTKKQLAWLKEQEANGCDRYVICLDQIMSGGLVNSRQPYQFEIALPNGIEDIVTHEEIDTLNYIAELAADPTNKVYLNHNITRLASTTGYHGYGSVQYAALREYGSQPRYPVHTPTTLDHAGAISVLTDMYNHYQYGKNGQKLGQTWGSTPYTLTNYELTIYHQARMRKMLHLNYLMENVPEAVYIVGIADSSPDTMTTGTIHTNEIEFIDTRMKQMGIDNYIYSDTDAIPMMALARCVVDDYGANPTVNVRYYGGGANEPADEYDAGTLASNTELHIQSAGCNYTTNGGGDVDMLIMTKPTNPAQTSTYVELLLQQLKFDLDRNMPTIVVDASNEYNFQTCIDNLPFQMLLDTGISLGKVLGYSNWNTVGNSLGIAIGQGIARYAYLRYADKVTDDSNIAFMQAMTFAYNKDVIYIAARVKSYNWNLAYDPDWSVSTTIIGKLGGGSSSNFYQAMAAYSDGSSFKRAWECCRGERVVNNALAYAMRTAGRSNNVRGVAGAYTYINESNVIARLTSTPFYTSLKPGAIETRNADSITIENYRFTWYRTFEMSFDIEVTLSVPAKQQMQISNGLLVNPNGTKEAPVSGFTDKVIGQYGSSQIAVRDLNGRVASPSAFIGTGFTATLTQMNRDYTTTSPNTNRTITTSYTVVVPKDVDGDGKISSTDSRYLLRSVGGMSLTPAQKKAGDTDGTGTISSTDARNILLAAVEIG